MPNINQRIEPVGRGGIPAMRRKIDEQANTINWLMGMRTTNGNPISEGGRGPIIDVNTPSIITVSQPWATDPDGNPGGWKKIWHLDFDGSVTGFTNALYRLWTWVGIPPSPPPIPSQPIPWMVDPSNVAAGWVVCADNTFWGTGNCPAGIGNFQQVHFVFNGPVGVNPAIYTGNVPTPPITPPTSPPAFYLETISIAGKPVLSVSIQMNSTDVTPITCNFTWTITYDGTQIFNVSGSVTAPDYNNELQYFPLDPTNWIYDPGGLPGYSHGSKQWIWQYQGVISANTNPTIVQTFSYTCPRLATVFDWTAILLTK